MNRLYMAASARSLVRLIGDYDPPIREELVSVSGIYYKASALKGVFIIKVHRNTFNLFFFK